MKTSRSTDSQIIAILKQAEAGSPVPEPCREHGIGNATFYKWRSRIDDFNREGLGIEVDFSLPSEGVIRSLDRIIEWRGKRAAIRCDSGPE